MRIARARLGVVVAGDRLVCAVVRARGVETFEVAAGDPAATLRVELDRRRVSARAVAVGLMRSAAIVKPIELPPVPGEIRTMVRFELERHLPFPAEDAPFDVLALPPAADRPADGRHVLVAATDRRTVDGALRVMEGARLHPRSLTVAVHDLLGLVGAARRRRVVWAHQTGGATDLLFLAGPTITLSRSVPSTDDRVVADEIRKSLTVTGWREIDAIWASGGGGGDGALGAGALGHLGAPVTEPPYTARARRRLAASGAASGASLLAIAVASGRRARALDLLPLPLRPRRLTRSQVLTLGTAAVTLLLAVAALFAPGYRQHRRLAAIDAEITRLDPETRAMEELLRELERRRRVLATIDTLESAAIRPLPVLRDLTELLPNDAWLTSLSLDATGVELTGQARVASALIPLLENSPRLERVEFASPVTRGREREQFRIRAAWEPPPAGARP